MTPASATGEPGALQKGNGGEGAGPQVARKEGSGGAGRSGFVDR